MAVEPLVPPALAEIVAAPTALAVTLPVASTEAMLALELVHAIAGFDAPLMTVALRAMVCPMISADVAGESVTDPPETVMLAVPVIPDAVAEIVAVPAIFAKTTPLSVTVATFGFDVVQNHRVTPDFPPHFAGAVGRRGVQVFDGRAAHSR